MKEILLKKEKYSGKTINSFYCKCIQSAWDRSMASGIGVAVAERYLTENYKI